MSTSSKRYKGSTFIVLFLVGMAIFGAVGFAITYWVGQKTGPYFKQRFEDQKKKEAADRERLRSNNTAETNQ